MDFDNHHFVAFGVFITLWLCFREITLSSILLPILLATVSDIDLKLKFGLDSHRNMFFHSIFFPGVILFFNQDVYIILILFSFGLHLLCDIRFKKVGGKYTLKYFKDKSIGGYWFATIWYLSNFLISLGILIYWLILV